MNTSGRHRVPTAGLPTGADLVGPLVGSFVNRFRLEDAHGCFGGTVGPSGADARTIRELRRARRIDR